MNESDRLEEVFSESLKLGNAEERRQYVERVCGGDVKLAEQVFALLSAAQAAGSFLESPVRRVGQTRETHPPTAADLRGSSEEEEFPFLSAPFDAGDIGSLGPYRILNCVGRGGMGIVFRAFEPKLHRVVAIKVLAPHAAADPVARRRFEREARSAAAVNHPHVVGIHAVGETHNPPYLVMEFVQGKTLADKLAAQGMLCVKEILQIGMQIADGLAAAHQRGLVHRDIKPANILMENGVERVKVTDFGLARAVDDLAMTRTGEVSGTPHFMSPEQISGEPIDHRSDLFSLGAVLYAMCTGKPPFPADNLFAAMKRICEETARPIRHANPDVPDWLAAIVGRLLAKSPADRYETAAEVAAVLQKHLAMIQAGWSFDPPVPEARARFPFNLRRARLAPILAVGFPVGIAALAWLALMQWQRDSRSLRPGGSQSSSRAVGLARPEAGAGGREVLPAGESARTAEARLAAAEENEAPDPFDGKNPGARRELTALKMAFRWCPAGRSTFGGPRAEARPGESGGPVEVTLRTGFWIQETEVTQSQWAGVMGSMPPRDMNKGKGDRHPIYHVSLNDANNFCKKLTELEHQAGSLPSGWGCRLPTEVQWEYACRAGTTTDTAYGDQLGSSQANFSGYWPHNAAPKGPSQNQAVEVGSYRPNDWGIYDMHGNVKEFTTTPGRVRGGSWFDSGRNCCSGIAIPDPPSASESVGFRVVLVSVPRE